MRCGRLVQGWYQWTFLVETELHMRERTDERFCSKNNGCVSHPLRHKRSRFHRLHLSSLGANNMRQQAISLAF